MAVQDGYGKVSGSESLVFAYDLKDTINSYRGEPTTNIIADPLYRLGVKNAQYDVNNTGWGTVTRGKIEEVIGPFGYAVQAYSQELISYTSTNRSIEGQPQDVVNNANCLVNLTSGITYRISVWIKATYTGTSQNRLYLSGTAAVGDGTNRQVTTEWQRISKTYTPSTSGAYYMRHYDYSTGKEVGAKIWYAHPQVEVDKGHPTQFIEGTRSATQGLLDLTGNSSIDLSNVSFDSNSQMSFDGTGDYADLSDQLSGLDTSTLSIEMVFKSTSTDTTFRPLMGINSDQTNVGYICLGNFTGHWPNESLSCIFVNSSGTIFLSFAYTAGSSTLKDNQYHHIVFNFQTNNYKIFVDGEEVVVNASFRNGSQSTTMISNLFNTIASPNITIGHAGSGSNGFLGEIPVVKIYNRVLTSTEVSNNYLKYKRQYGLT